MTTPATLAERLRKQHTDCAHAYHCARWRDEAGPMAPCWTCAPCDACVERLETAALLDSQAREIAELTALRTAPEWTCCECGGSEAREIKHVSQDGDEYDMECAACGSCHMAESPREAARTMGLALDAQAAEIERMREALREAITGRLDDATIARIDAVLERK